MKKEKEVTERGFTLVELVVVLMLAAVLVSLAVPRFTDRRALDTQIARTIKGYDHMAAIFGHSDNAQELREYLRRGKKIIVTWVSAPATHHSASSNYRAGDTAQDLADLVGAKAGQAEGELQRRGYTYATGSTSGNSQYSSWFNGSTGRCVMIRTEQGRYQSIVQTSPVDCGR